MAQKIYACDFEIFGIVQGVFFRKHTQKQANAIGVKGWCRNTEDGTVKGQIEGYDKPIKEMQNWLMTVGSPNSRIDQAVYSPVREIKKFSFKKFEIIK